MSEVAIKIDNLSKVYRIGAQRKPYGSLREEIYDFISARFRRMTGKSLLTDTKNTIWALKDVSLEVKHGEVLGVIGRNGAGKSTLLKILSRITEPTKGRVELHGRVGSLLEVGTGFHQELTGRENIFLNGAILGMTREEIKGRFDEIVDFSGIEKMIDTPVKFYSSGMYVRLAFAVAAHLEPDILLVDEVLAVGDAAFQKKCLGKMADVTKEGRTILFVSHNMGAVENLCPESFLLDDGHLLKCGTSQEVIAFYLEKILPFTFEGMPLADRKNRSGNQKIIFTHFHIEDSNGRKIKACRSGMDTVFVFGFSAKDGQNLKNIDVGFSLKTLNEHQLFVFYGSYVGQVFQSVPSKGEFKCLIPGLPLSPGRYKVGARITIGGEEADWPKDAIGFLDVESGDFYGTGNMGFGATAPFMISGNWECVEN